MNAIDLKASLRGPNTCHLDATYHRLERHETPRAGVPCVKDFRLDPLGWYVAIYTPVMASICPYILYPRNDAFKSIAFI